MNRRDALKKMLLAGIGLGIVPYTINKGTLVAMSSASAHEHILAAVGDVTLANYFDDTINYLSRQKLLNPYDYVLKDIIAEFKNIDLCIANMEGTLTDAHEHETKQFYFHGSPKHVEILEKMNVKIVNLANNHFMDYLSRGAIDTIDTLNRHDIKYCGGGLDAADAESPRFIDVGDVKLGFLGYAMVGHGSKASNKFPGTNAYDKDAAKIQISRAKDLCDLLVVSCHWGIERQYTPCAGQLDAAKIFMDSGADIILGHHPHVLQEVREYNNKIVCYSLGNFIFGGNSGPKDKNSMIMKLRLNSQGVIDYKKIPLSTHNDGLVMPKILA